MNRRQWRILAKHKWVNGCTITESHHEFKSDSERAYRRFTATIDGWRNFKLYEGYLFDNEMLVKAIVSRVNSIRERIQSGDNSVFNENTEIKGIR